MSAPKLRLIKNGWDGEFDGLCGSPALAVGGFDGEFDGICGSPAPAVGGFEVLLKEVEKSIVYGGLAESITSLGVVSSAAGAGATTFSIWVWGLVILIGGLLIFCQNLRELKNEQYQWNEESRYQKLLGRRENFPLHASLAVISFLFFGLLPPIIYGFSFRESDNKNLKLEAVLGASLICITLLAIAKCHVNKSSPKSYIKTILYYMSTGVAVSCVSYLVGELIKNFVEKLGWFDSTSTISISSIYRDA
ncbi:hypothetical protein Patl1_27132 [Pistacia atlantica]|uniref:Uncharacterized protein n=1 Tax=Pistacia atlantica TaxID=434234 RepID=A0ACC1B2Z4_9ROSI|nr:hypothetical protein Patl1_27132 [Pistacia atlantica]